MNTAHQITDIKITEKKNMYGEIFDVDSLSYDELFIYIGCLVEFENKKYWVAAVEHEACKNRSGYVFKGKTRIN